MPRKTAKRDQRTDPKPKVFVASSSSPTSLKYARAIQDEFAYELEIVIWTQGIFRPSHTALDSLLRKLDVYDFGIFVFTPEDVVRMLGREDENKVARDNVVFELGLFIGRLGKERNFIVVPRGKDLRLPTDLVGVSPVT